MAQDISLLGATYLGVPAVALPKVGGGMAVFTDRDREVLIFDYEPGYIGGNTWNYQNSDNNHSDIYEVEAGHKYALILGKEVGTRFRAVVLDTNPAGTTQNYTGTNVVNKNDPKSGDSVVFTSAIDGFLIVTKDNVSVTGLKSYLLDLTIEEEA